MHRKCLRMCTSCSRREYLVSFRMAIIMKMLCVKGDLISYKSSFKSHKLPLDRVSWPRGPWNSLTSELPEASG